MLALAICNIAGSFIRSMPTCGAFTRSALSQASGVRTTMSNIYASSLILLATLFLTPHFHLIPRCILSAVLISAVIFLVDYQIVKPLWKTNREYIIFTVTFRLRYIKIIKCKRLMRLYFHSSLLPSGVNVRKPFNTPIDSYNYYS